MPVFHGSLARQYHRIPKTTTSKQEMASSQTHIHLVRHGHVYNPQDVVYGRLPRFRLSEKGIQQARSAASFFKSQPIAALFSSPLLRARQTAKEINDGSSHGDIKISRLITEIHSSFEGRPSKEADALGGDVYSGAGPEFEQPADIVDRTLRFFKRVTTRYGGHHVAAVTHGDVIVFALLWAKGYALDPGYKGRLGPLGIQHGYPAHGSVTTFAFDRHRADTKPILSYWEPE